MDFSGSNNNINLRNSPLRGTGLGHSATIGRLLFCILPTTPFSRWECEAHPGSRVDRSILPGWSHAKASPSPTSFLPSQGEHHATQGLDMKILGAIFPSPCLSCWLPAPHADVTASLRMVSLFPHSGAKAGSWHFQRKETAGAKVLE